MTDESDARETRGASADPEQPYTAVPVPKKLYDKARAFDIDVEQVCRQALGAAIKAEDEQRLAAYVEAANRWIEKNGLPLEQYRMF
jgi:antitoxin CcdA